MKYLTILLIAELSFSSDSFTFKLQPSRRSEKVFRVSQNDFGRRSSLQMSIAPVVNVAITGGLAGGLHAVAGPDHLAALLPKCCGQRWYGGARIGALWGIGHGISSLIIGIAAFALKNRLNNIRGISTILNGAAYMLELAVGASLIIVGLMGIHEAREWEEEMKNLSPRSLSAAAVDPHVASPQKRGVIINGLLNGFCWDGVPSLAPALAVTTWKGNVSFLLSYAFGTAAIMSFTTTLVSEGTRKASQLFNRPDIPQKLSLFSSGMAILVGMIWIALGFK